MRVLYIDHTAALGGGEIALANLVHHIDPSLVDPTVLLFSDGPLMQKLGRAAQTHVLALPSAVGHANRNALGWRSFLLFREIWLVVRHVFRVAAFARSIRAELVHTNSLKADIIGGLAGRLAGVPVVWHVRDRIEVDYLPKTVVRAFRILSKFIPNYVIANSEATLETLHLESHRPRTATEATRVKKRHQVIHDGCEVRPLGVSEVTYIGYDRVGLVGRISPWKGQDVFLRAAAEVLKQRPGTKFEIIGSALFDESDYESSLHTLCRTLGIEHAVNFVGFVQDVPARIAQLSILVHASTTAEPFGQVIIEAMAEGKPVVATKGGGVLEIVNDGITGLLVPMGDADCMAEAIGWLLAHPQEAANMGSAGRERVYEKFTIQRTAAVIQSAYRDVLDGK